MLPSNQPRSCFTIWLSQGERRAHSAAVAGSAGVLPPPDAGSDSDAVWRFLMQPAVRQHVCKLAYAGKVWAESKWCVLMLAELTELASVGSAAGECLLLVMRPQGGLVTAQVL